MIRRLPALMGGLLLGYGAFPPHSFPWTDCVLCLAGAAFLYVAGCLTRSDTE